MNITPLLLVLAAVQTNLLGLFLTTCLAYQEPDNSASSSIRLPAQVIKDVEQSVVLIRSESRGPLGSGFVIDAHNQIIATNLHVVEEQNRVIIEFYDGASDAATEYVAVSVDCDLILLKCGVKASRYPSLPLANTLPEKIDSVLSFGSPLGLKGTVTSGTVSALRLSSELGKPTKVKLIQHSAPISPGNSGGPLVNKEGQVVGVNTMTIEGDSLQNINFAVAALHVSELLHTRGPKLYSLSTLDNVAGTSRRTDVSEPTGDDENTLKVARKFVTEGLIGRAIQALDSINSKKRGVGYWRCRGEALFLLSDFREASACFRAALLMDMSESDTWVRYATSMRMDTLNHSEAILRACQIALWINPEESRAFHIMGLTTLSGEKRVDAFKSAISLDESDLASHFHLACALRDIDSDTEALEHYRKALALSRSSDLYLVQGDEPQFATDRRKRLRDFSSKSSLETFIRIHVAAASSNEERIKECRRILESEPDSRLVRFMLGITLRNEGELRGDPMMIRMAEKFIPQGETDVALVLEYASFCTGTAGLLIVRK